MGLGFGAAVQALRSAISDQRKGNRRAPARDDGIAAWTAAVALLVGRANAKADALLEEAATATPAERTAIAGEIRRVYHELQDTLATMARPSLLPILEAAIAAAAGGEEVADLTGVAALEAAVFQAQQDSRRAVDDALAALAGLAVSGVGDAALRRRVADQEERRVDTRLALVVAVVGVGLWATVKLDVFGRRGVSRIRFVHAGMEDAAHPCPICEPYVGRVYDVARVPVPPLHPNCDCDLEAVPR